MGSPSGPRSSTSAIRCASSHWEARRGPITADIADFTPERRYDLVLANPPFVPTPDGIAGTLTSNGGAEGSRLVKVLLERLDDLLEPTGRALVYVFQLATERGPLVLDLLAATLERRPVEVTPAQERPLPFETYCRAYHRLFPEAGEAIERWRLDRVRRHGSPLALCHYVVDIGPRSDAPTRCVIREDFAEKFGASFRVPSGSDEELALGRVLENVIPG